MSVRVDELARLAYAAGLDASMWPKFLANLSDTVGYAALALHTHDYRRNRNVNLVMHNYDQQFRESYRQYYAKLNPWNTRAARAPIGSAIASPALLPPEFLKSTEFYHDWIRPQDDIGTGAGITLYRDRGRFLRLSANIRFKEGEQAVDRLVRVLNSLAPHMRAAFDLARTLSAERIGVPYQDALELAEGAVAVVDSLGRICVSNTRWHDCLCEGTHLRSRHGRRLTFVDDAASDALEAFLIKTREGQVPPPVAMLLNSEGRPKTALRISAFFASGEPDLAPFVMFPENEPAAIIVIRTEPSPGSVPRHAFARTYGLTGAESALLEHLMAGRGLRDFAEGRRVSLNTVRTQMKSLLNKTGTGRQAELVALAIRTPRPT